MVGLHRSLGTWVRSVDAFIVLSDYQKQMMVKGGLPAAKVHVKPHFFPTSPIPVSWAQRGDYGVYVGRLSKEKGISTLVNAWRLWGEGAPMLQLIGDGPMRATLEALAEGLPIRFLGQRSPNEVLQEIAHARFLILPSECIETFGLVIIEAMAHGTPVIVSDQGPLPTIVSEGINGRVFKAGDGSSLMLVMQQVWCSPGESERLGQAGHVNFERNYSSDRNYDALMEIYDRATFSFRSAPH